MMSVINPKSSGYQLDPANTGRTLKQYVSDKPRKVNIYRIDEISCGCLLNFAEFSVNRNELITDVKIIFLRLLNPTSRINAAI